VRIYSLVSPAAGTYERSYYLLVANCAIMLLNQTEDSQEIKRRSPANNCWYGPATSN